MKGGTEVINGWYQALITWALVLAVGAVIAFACLWTVGNLRSTPQTSSRGKHGIAVAIAATMLLGGSKVYLQTLYDKWAPGFQPDPASYAVADSPAKSFEVIDRSQAWDAQITKLRTENGYNVPVSADPQLSELASNCARWAAGDTAAQCPDGVDGAWTMSYNSAQLAMIDGLPTKDQLDPLLAPFGDDYVFGNVDPGVKPDVRYAAWVAAVNPNTKHAKLIGVFAAAPCNQTCMDPEGHIHKPVMNFLTKGQLTHRGEHTPIGGG